MIRGVLHQRLSVLMRPIRILRLVVGLLVLKVIGSIVSNYPDYFPANFESSFLQDRRTYFFGWYQWAFYAHILSAPVALGLGVILMNEAFRCRFPKWHRYLGRVHGVFTLFLVAPSGLAMAWHASTGMIAGMGFATSSLLTGFCTAMGWRTAVQRRFQIHRRWMTRSFLLLCSAVVLRLMAGLSDVTDLGGEWLYPLSAWISWMIPLAAYEAVGRWGRRRQVAIPKTSLVVP